MDRSLKKRKREEETEDDHQLSFEKITMKKVLLVSSSKHDQQVCQAISDTLQDQNVSIEVTKDLTENQNLLCVVSLNSETEDVVKLNQWCDKRNVSFLWGQIHSSTLSVFCYPDLALIDSFQGENPRPENDLLLSQHITLNNDDNLHVTCTKKHFLTSDDEVHLCHSGLQPVPGRVEIINDKEFLMKRETPEASFKCDDETYIVKLMKRSSSSKEYLLFNESLKNPSFSQKCDSSQVALHNQRILQNEKVLEDDQINYPALLGSILGCEIYSSMIKKTRLPMHQWLHVNLSSQEKTKSTMKDQVDRIIVLSKNVFSDCLKNVLKKSCDQVEVMDSDEFLRMDLSGMPNALVICCGETYEKRSTIAEKCKVNTLKYIDAGLSQHQAHVQTIFPGESALFDSIVDYEDLSEEALHCIIKSFPTNIDHCIQWAVRKLNSWCKQKSSTPEKFAKDKFNKNFIAKPKELLKNFPPEENPEKWKPPNRIPKIDIVFSQENELHENLVNNLMNLFELSNNSANSEEEFCIPSGLENSLLLDLTKMRAFVYKIEIYESDCELLRRAKKSKTCLISTANLASNIILHEIQKLGKNLENQDWWISELNGFSLLSSKSAPKMRQIGNLTLNQWDNFSVVLQEDWTLKDFLEHMMQVVGLNVNMVTQNSKMIYVKALPTHVKKLQKTFSTLMTFEDSRNVALIHVSADEIEDDLISVEIKRS